MPVFGAVDGFRRRPQNRDGLSVQAHGEVVGNLPAHRNDDAFGRFKFRYVQNRFQREFIEVQSIAHVVVGRNGFRIAVYHHAPVSFRLNGFNRADAAPVKLHRRPDSVRPGTENDNRAAVFVEFDVVFLPGLEEGVFPTTRALTDPDSLEEERRLFYVAVTRAEKQVTLSYAQNRFNNGQRTSGEVSRFIEEIDSKFIELPDKRRGFAEAGTLPRAFFNAGKPQPESSGRFKKKPAAEPVKRGPAIANSPAQINSIMPGMKVSHDKFGIGKVLNIEGDGDSRKATVFFEGVGSKQLMLKFAKLSIVED